MAKFIYHGKSNEELKAMTMEEFVKTIPSNMRRALRRNGVKYRKFIAKLDKVKKKGKKSMRTHVREMVILPSMLEMDFMVYTGKEWQKVVIKPEMLGHRLGEYAITVKQVRHSGPGIGATRGSKSVELK